MSFHLDKIRKPRPRFILLYPPLQFMQGELAKPDGSLSLAYLAGALRRCGYEVKILDCSVGDETTKLSDTFFHSIQLPNKLFRVGMATEAILERVSAFDVVGITSIFTPQTTMVLDLIREIKKAFPEKLILSGGVNARNLRYRFYESGCDMIALSESETTIVQIADAIHKGEKLTGIAGLAFLDEAKNEVVNPAGPVTHDLDELPLPAWDLLPLNRYWDISRPHGGEFLPGKRIAYASLQTSRGCPFSCQYCHISQEGEGSLSGNIKRFRMKSIPRVIKELETLKALGVEYVFLEDDSLFAKKNRAYELMRIVKEVGLNLLNVNGINICHLLKRNQRDFEVDIEFLEALKEANLDFLTLPFESASQRIIDKYATSKLHLASLNTQKLFKAFEDLHLRMSGNYMFGYPDETAGEVYETIMMARQHVEQGINYASFFTVVPFPGTALFNMVIQNGQLDPQFNPDEMRWTKSILKNLAIDADTLEQMRKLAWLLINPSKYVKYKQEMVMPSLTA